MMSTKVRYCVVSDHPDYRVGTDGSVWTKKSREAPGKWRRLKPGRKGTQRAPTVTFYVRGKGLKDYRVSRLVLETFVGPCPPGMVARHFPDRNVMNCHLTNLSWASQKINIGDKVFHKTENKWERNGRCKVTREEVSSIRRRFDRGKITHKQAKEELGLSTAGTSFILTRRTWKGVE